MGKEFKIADVIEQECTFDGGWKLPIDSYLLMKIVNYLAAENDGEIAEMEDPQRTVVRVTIETRKR